jgi:hypothetical protein
MGRGTTVAGARRRWPGRGVCGPGDDDGGRGAGWPGAAPAVASALCWRRRPAYGRALGQATARAGRVVHSDGLAEAHRPATPAPCRHCVCRAAHGMGTRARLKVPTASAKCRRCRAVHTSWAGPEGSRVKSRTPSGVPNGTHATRSCATIMGGTICRKLRLAGGAACRQGAPGPRTRAGAVRASAARGVLQGQRSVPWAPFRAYGSPGERYATNRRLMANTVLGMQTARNQGRRAGPPRGLAARARRRTGHGGG